MAESLLMGEKMAVPKYDEWMRPTLELLSDGNEHTVKDMDETIAEHFKLSQEDKQELLPSRGAKVYKSRANWARVYLLKANLLVRTKKACYQITDAGLDLLKDPDVTHINANVLKRYPSFTDFFYGHNEDLSSDKVELDQNINQMGTPDEIFESSITKINDALIDDILAEISQIDDYRFEQFVLDLLKKIGYGISGEIKGTTKSKDLGIDGVIYDDKLGFNRIYVQVKKYSKGTTVGRPDLQSFVGAISGLDGKGLFVTTSDFSQGAKDYAGQQNIVLVNGRRLAELMIEHNFGVSTRKVYYIKGLDTDLFAEYIESD